MKHLSANQQDLQMMLRSLCVDISSVGPWNAESE